MQQNFSATVLELFTYVDRLSKSPTLNQQDQDNLQNIKFLAKKLGKHFDNAEREISNLKQSLQQIEPSYVGSRTENEI